MAISKTQSVNATISGSTVTLTINGVAAGAFLSVQLGYFRGSNTTAPALPTDTNGTLVQAEKPAPIVFATLNGLGAALWYEENAASGTHTVTITLTAGNSGQATLTEWAGMATSGSLDVHTNAGVDGTNQTSQVSGTTGVTAQASELALVAFAVAANPGAANIAMTKDANYTRLTSGSNDATDIGYDFDFQILSATGTQHATETWTDATEVECASQGVIAVFKAAAGGGFTPVFRSTLSGIGARVGSRQAQRSH